MAGSTPDKSVPTSKPRKLPFTFMLAASLYAVWFIWLAYVAWVNISAGNQ